MREREREISLRVCVPSLQLPLCNAAQWQLLACPHESLEKFSCGNFNATLPIASRCAVHFFCDTFKRHATPLLPLPRSARHATPSLALRAMRCCMCNIKWNVKGKSTFLTRCNFHSLSLFCSLALSLSPGKVHLKVAATKRKTFQLTAN